MKKSILLLILCIPVLALGKGKWEATRSVDQMTDEVTCTLSCVLCGAGQSARDKTQTSFTIGKLNSKPGKMLLVAGFLRNGIEVSDTGYFRVDGNKAIKSTSHAVERDLVLHIFDNDIDTMIDQMIAGTLLRVSNGDEVFKISLIGFTKGYNQYRQCK